MLAKIEHPYVYIESGHLDFRDIKSPKLPSGVIVCFSCLGNGKKVQRYCDAPTMTGPCDSYLCGGNGFMYTDTCRGVPASVTNQIAVMNGLDQTTPWKSVPMYGLSWKRALALSPHDGKDTP